MLLNLVGPERKLHRADKTIEKRLTFLTSDQISYSPIGIGMEKNDTGSYNPAIGYPHINKLGVKWVRIQSGWFRTEKEAGVYDFAWLDDIVDNILSQGCTPWMCLCYGNSVYDDTAVPGSRATDHPPIYTQDARLAWQRYVKACLAHFKGRVHYYEIWNEPDGTHCWGQGVNGAEYADLVRITAPLIRQADSDNKVIAGCMCNLVRMQTFCDEDYVGVNFDSDPGIGPFFRNWYQKDVAQMIDYVTFHSYAPRPEQKMNELYAALRKTLDMYNPNIGIIQGETGVHSDFSRHGALNSGEWNCASQYKFLLRRLTTDVANGAFFASYFSMLDMYENLQQSDSDIRRDLYGFYGVLGAEFDEEGRATGVYNPKPSYTALQCLATVMAEGVEREADQIQFCVFRNVYWGSTDLDENSPMGDKLTTYTLRRKAGDRMYIYYLASPLIGFTYDGSTSLMLPEPMEHPAVLDLANGAIYAIDNDHITMHDGKQVLLRVMLRDYPLAIIDLDNTSLVIN